MLSVGSKAAYAYDPDTGDEIWKVKTGGFSGASRVAFADGVAYIATGNGKSEMLAVNADGAGDITKTHVKWRTGKGAPGRTSPILADGLLYLLKEDGVLSCVDAKTGDEVWKERVGKEFSASPLLAGDKIYCFPMDGKATVAKAGRTYAEVAANELDAGCLASPAVDGKALFVRTKTHLYRIEDKK